MMRSGWLLCLVVSGCCCDVPGIGGSTQTWDSDVKRAKANPQTEALEPGTANVFSLEVMEPVTFTQAQQDAWDDHLERLEIAKLELRRSDVKNDGRGAELRQAVAEVEAEPTPDFGPLRTVARYRFTVLHPYSMLFDSGFQNDGCSACINEANRKGSRYLYSPGHVQLQLPALTRAQLLEGVEVHGSFSIGSVGEANTRSIELSSAGKGVVKLVQSCLAEVAFVTKSVHVGNGSGVIAVPRSEERSWFELRDASCAEPGIVEEIVVKTEPRPPRKTTENGFRIMQLRAMIDRGE